MARILKGHGDLDIVARPYHSTDKASEIRSVIRELSCSLSITMSKYLMWRSRNCSSLS